MRQWAAFALVLLFCMCVATCSTPKPVVALYAERLVTTGYDPVATVFGFQDDMSACNDIAEAISKRYNGRKFYCAFATQSDIADAGLGKD